MEDYNLLFIRMSVTVSAIVTRNENVDTTSAILWLEQILDIQLFLTFWVSWPVSVNPPE